mgnify:CR=1 FL=1
MNYSAGKQVCARFPFSTGEGRSYVLIDRGTRGTIIREINELAEVEFLIGGLQPFRGIVAKSFLIEDDKTGDGV